MTSFDDHRRSYAAFASAQFARWANRLAVAGVVIVVLAVFGIVGAIDKSIEEETGPQVHERMQRAAAAAELERGLRACPAPGPGMTDQVVMVMRYDTFDAPTVTRCFRIAERSVAPRRRSRGHEQSSK